MQPPKYRPVNFFKGQLMAASFAQLWNIAETCCDTPPKQYAAFALLYCRMRREDDPEAWERFAQLGEQVYYDLYKHERTSLCEIVSRRTSFAWDKAEELRNEAQFDPRREFVGSSYYAWS